MTIALQDNRSAKPFSLQASRVCVPPVPEQSAPDTSASSDELVEHVDGDLLQTRALADRHPQSPTSLARLATSELSFGNRVSPRAAAERTLKTDTFDAPAMLVAAQTLVALGEISSAEQALQRVLDSSDTGEGAMRAASALAARIAAHNGQNQKAPTLLEQCDNLAGLSLKGSLLAQAGQHHDAIRTLRAALTDTPDSPGVSGPRFLVRLL